MENLTSLEQFEKLKQEKRVVFKFTADWCPNCHFIDPFMGEVEEEFPDFTFLSVDRDKFIDLCSELNILGIPSFVAYDHGAEIGRFVSKDRKKREEIESFLRTI